MHDVLSAGGLYTAAMTVHAAATVITLYRAGQTLREIGVRLGISPNTVHAILVRQREPRRGPRRYRRPPTEAELSRDAAVIAAYRAGHSLDAVSRKFGISKTLVWKILVRHGEPRRTTVQGRAARRIRRGEVTISQRDTAIIAAHRNGKSMRQIGIAFGISGARVSQILHRHGSRRRAD